MKEPRGNVARYWLRKGYREAAHTLGRWALLKSQKANAMNSEYDDPSFLHCQADILNSASAEFDRRANKLEPKRKRG